MLADATNIEDGPPVLPNQKDSANMRPAHFLTGFDLIRA
jgi:hypothetical protein